MRKLAILCLLGVNFLSAAESIQWNSGVLVLHSEEIFHGQIALNQAYNVVFLQHGEEVQVYPAHKIKSLYYFDANANVNRTFITIQHRENAANLYSMYEMVLSGDISVLRKATALFSEENDKALNYDYYILQ